ncbi:calcium-binding protein [Rhizobium sp. P40RR-XXII]|uniref:EF-hand domain-containing protein n=1 Tax=unclassified Rhizobium TaxID=2613769 RepID=UPI0014575DF8|nr:MULTISPECIES: EF-hand domain-containing protein [unclassified Rhizobium]NLR87583.1 calcium-binding protein [Rhizobium sp. P28RR-XV]NLS18243.1 calcium-binding protein [Rhizobium sp. P40RR-XXII]
MNGKKFLLAGLSAALLVGAAAQASFAAQGDEARGEHSGRWHGPRFSPEIVYVRMLKQFGQPGDTKVTKDEVKAGVDKIFDQIDTNHDGEITPGELRAYRQERIKEWKAEHAKADGDQAQNDQSKGDEAQADNNGPRHHRPHGRFMHEAGLMRGMMLFHRIDKDENGQISKQEAEDAANKLFDRMDRNHDGAISLDDMPNRPLL